jgi:hypothetical protein
MMVVPLPRVRRIPVALLGWCALVLAGCGDDSCPKREGSAANLQGTQLCACGVPGNCRSDFVWPAVCREGQWVCPPSGG